MLNAERVTINTEYIKLDQFLKFAGAVVTGGHASERVKAGGVMVNGEECTMRGKKLRPGDKVEADGKCYEVAGRED